MEAHVCPRCGEELRMAWIGFDPPEPYGEVCGCPDPDFADARADKAATDEAAIDRLTRAEIEAVRPGKGGDDEGIGACYRCGAPAFVFIDDDESPLPACPAHQPA